MKFNEKHLQLICGDPRKEPATFSRFVFPFAYDLHRYYKSPTLYYQDCMKGPLQAREPDIFEARKTYFTHETSEVLFESTKWLEMDEENWNQSVWAKSVSLCCRGKTIAVSMLPPRLALFEWPPRPPGKGGAELFQTGFLMIDIYFPPPSDSTDPPELDDLLYINEHFRYFQCPYDEHWAQFRELLCQVPVEYCGKTPKRVGDSSVQIRDAYLDRWTRLIDFPLYIPSDNPIADRWYTLGKEKRQNLHHPPSYSQNSNHVYADNRTYVWCAAILKNGAGALKKAYSTSNWRAHQFGHWIKLLNIDPPDTTGCPGKTHSNVRQFERSWAKDRTYQRWEEWGTWYGFNYHSGVMLGPPFDVPDVPFWRHFRRMYFDMVLLLFYVRVSLFRFSRQLTEITPKFGEYQKKTRKSFSKLRGAFSFFTIRYQYPLLSNQQQAIEMNELARKHFDIDDLYREIKQEIDSTHEFLDSQKQLRLNETATILARWGIPIAVGALVASIFGMNANQYPLYDWVRIHFGNPSPSVESGVLSNSLWVMIIIIIIFSIVAFLLVLCKSRGHKND